MMSNESFADLLAEYGDNKRLRLNVGDKVRGTVIHVTDTTVFCQLSRSQEAFLPRESAVDTEGQLTVRVGDTIEAYVVRTDDGIELSRRIGKDQIDLALLEEAQKSGLPVQGTVTGINKGGLEVSIGGARGFCPIGQADLGFVADPAVFVGKTFDFAVREVREGGRNVLVSRRVLLERDRRERGAKTLEQLAEGKEVAGTVSRLQPFGAFVDLGGVDGLIAISELSHARVNDPAEVLKVGDIVTVKVLRIEADPKRQGEKRIALSLKAATPDPFTTFAAQYSAGQTLAGKVAKLESYGAFVELAPGLQGLVHISEIANRRIGHPREVLNVGQAVTARILSIDVDKKRISLSLKDAPPALPEDVSQDGVGAVVEGTVDRIERYGVFLKLASGKSALLPAAESGSPRGADLAKTLPIGTRLTVKIIEIDDRGRLKVSKRAREEDEERADMASYMQQSGNKQGFGTTFGDLLKRKQVQS